LVAAGPQGLIRPESSLRAASSTCRVKRHGVVTGESVGEQTQVALENLAAVLADAGAGLSDVVRCGVFLADIADFEAMNSVYAKFFPAPLPARTTVGAGLDGFLVEIDCVAVLPPEG